MHNKTIRWVFVAIIFATLLLSSKRGGFIAFFLALIIYAVVEWQMAGKGDPKRVLLILGSVILAMAFYYFFTSFTKANNLAMLDRLENLANDDGSGRPDVWACVWRMILASDPMSLLIGHGFNMTFLKSFMTMALLGFYFICDFIITSGNCICVSSPIVLSSRRHSQHLWC